MAAADESLDDLLEEDEPDSPRRCDRRQSLNPDKQGTLSHFGPRQVTKFKSCLLYISSI